MIKIFSDEEDFVTVLRDDTDIYSELAIEVMIDDDAITAEEAGFMRGYNDAM